GYRIEAKGIPTLLRAYATVRAKRPATRLRLVGRSPSDETEAEWHRLAHELGVADGLSFEGPADRAGVAAAMGRAALWVHPSRTETMGVVAVEALASGLPIVATDSGGVTEVLGPDPAAVGALVPTDQPDALAAAILAVLERRHAYDPELLRAHVTARYGASAVAAQLVDLYRAVISERAPRGRREVADVPRRPAWPAAAMTRQAERSPASAAAVVVVAFDRPYLDKLVARFPSWVLDGAVVVSTGEPAAGLPRLVRADGIPPRAMSTYLSAGISSGAGKHGLAARIVGLPAFLRQVRARRRLNARTLPLLEAAVDRALDLAGATVEAPALLVCVGGIDVFVARRAARSGRAVVAPGGLKGLADQRWRERTAEPVAASAHGSGKAPAAAALVRQPNPARRPT
ncbi:MAG TPA: glycosyltransferase, partial [Candidatus Binatus sp.]|nr:glycosyltransferase [Candidatus Binatus sp.]